MRRVSGGVRIVSGGVGRGECQEGWGKESVRMGGVRRVSGGVGWVECEEGRGGKSVRREGTDNTCNIWQRNMYTHHTMVTTI